MQNDVFKYIDESSSRAEIVAASEKLALKAIAIVGIGGTGSYILDLVAKTHVKSIHLYDDDRFEIHNAFRSPGATSRETLMMNQSKAEHFRDIYSTMRNNIFAHGYIDTETIEELKEMDFVFLAAELGRERISVAEKLEEYDVPFIDVGMGLSESNATLRGVLRVTTSTEESRRLAKHFLPAPKRAEDDLYSRNIQVADLNALNATLAVVKWKKMFGFYDDFEKENNSRYLISTNRLLNQGHTE